MQKQQIRLGVGSCQLRTVQAVIAEPRWQRITQCLGE